MTITFPHVNSYFIVYILLKKTKSNLCQCNQSIQSHYATSITFLNTTHVSLLEVRLCIIPSWLAAQMYQSTSRPSNSVLVPEAQLSACRLVNKTCLLPGHQSIQINGPKTAAVSHHHPPLRKSASPRRCRHGNTGPAGAAVPGPPRSLPFPAPGRGSWGPRGGCRKRWHRDAAQSATGQAQAPTGGKS